MKKQNSLIKTEVLNCFGFDKTHKLTVEQVYELLSIARNPWLSLYYDKTPPAKIYKKEDYAVGHAGLKYGEILKHRRRKHSILLTTDKAKTVDVAIEMADKGVNIFGKKVKIKLEVLSKDDTHPINKAVIQATEILRSDDRNYRIWPIINYNEEDIRKLVSLGVEVIRILRGPIGCNGSVKELPELSKVGKLGLELRIPIILEGGLGGEYHIYEALRTPGIEAVLVNSCLFKRLKPDGRGDPSHMMKTIRHAADLAIRNKEYHGYSTNCCSISRYINTSIHRR